MPRNDELVFLLPVMLADGRKPEYVPFAASSALPVVLPWCGIPHRRHTILILPRSVTACDQRVPTATSRISDAPTETTAICLLGRRRSSLR